MYEAYYLLMQYARSRLGNQNLISCKDDSLGDGSLTYMSGQIDNPVALSI